MYYAADNRLSTSPIEGGVQVTAAQYSEALNTLMSGGHVFIHNGAMVLTYKPENKEGFHPPVWQGGDWHFEPLPEPELEEKGEKND